MPVLKAGSPTEMIQRGGKPQATATEAENPIKTTNEDITEQDEKDVSSQSEILDPDKDRNQDHSPSTPRKLGKITYYVPPSHDDLTDLRAENSRLREILADKEIEIVCAKVKVNALLGHIEDTNKSAYGETRAGKSEDKWRHHQGQRERQSEKIEREKAMIEQCQEQNKRDRVRLEVEKELLAFRMKEIERLLAEVEAD